MSIEASSRLRECWPVIYTDIDESFFQNRYVFLTEEVDETKALDLVQRVNFLDSIDNRPIYLIINSPGGDVYCGAAIINVLRCCKSPVYTVATGLVASMATYIFACGQKRYAYPNCYFMLHKCQVEWVSGEAADLDIHQKQLALLDKDFMRILSEACSKQIKKLQSDIEREFWLTTTQARNYKLVTDVVVKNADVFNDVTSNVAAFNAKLAPHINPSAVFDKLTGKKKKTARK